MSGDTDTCCPPEIYHVDLRSLLFAVCELTKSQYWTDVLEKPSVDLGPGMLNCLHQENPGSSFR